MEDWLYIAFGGAFVTTGLALMFYARRIVECEKPSTPMASSYFVSYTFTHGKYLNGARMPGYAMSQVDLLGEVDSWEKIQALRTVLEKHLAEDHNTSSPVVTIVNYIPLS